MIIKTCHNGHFLYSSFNILFCANGSGCYHKIKKGRHAHEFKYEYMKNEYCLDCERLCLNKNLEKVK